MCGIFGLFSSRPLDVPDILHRADEAARRLAARGPDQTGIDLLSDHGVLGATRLAILGGRSCDQPIVSARGRYRLAFNGEIYNHREIRARTERTFAYATDGDGETALALFDRYGVPGLTELDGMFAIAIYDSWKRTLTLARDRFGAKPLYYREDRAAVGFASDIVALAALVYLPFEVRLSALRSYIRFKAPLGENSVFEGVRRVEPGCAVSMLSGELRTARFATVPPINVNRQNLRDVAALIEENCLRTHFDGPASILLSGGVDSSVVAAVLGRAGSSTAVTVGYSEPAFQGDERKRAANTAAFLGLDHLQVELASVDVPELLSTSAAMLQEPLYASTSLSTLVAFQACGPNRVVYCGDGADELFLGYANFQGVQRVAEAGGDWKAAYEASIGWCPGWARELFDVSWREEPDLLDLCGSWEEEGRQSPLELVRMFEFRYRLPDYQMPRIDRLAMGLGIEARAPYLRNRISDHFLATPATALIADGSCKAALRELARSRLPPDVAQRPKQKFSAPVEEWLTRSWRPLVERYLLDTDLSPLGLDKRAAATLLQRCRERGPASVPVLWGLMILAAWWVSFGSIHATGVRRRGQ